MSDSLISIIVPVLNESGGLQDKLTLLQPLRDKGHELIVVDGGSSDNTVSVARKLCDRLLISAPGRAFQMNTGAEYAKHEILLFLHADTELPAGADILISTALSKSSSVWGRFDIRLSNPAFIYRFIAATINLRTWISGIATGDQAIFIERNYFEKVRGYEPIPLMEDVSLSKKMLKYARPACPEDCVITSSRRWETHGIINTVLLMWRLRTAYFFGASPERLVKAYYKTVNADGRSRVGEKS